MTESAWLQTPLFAGIPPKDADKLLSCLQGERKRFQKGEMIYRAGEQARALGLVLGMGGDLRPTGSLIGKMHKDSIRNAA